MNFDNFTDEQIEWLEGKFKEAHYEGWNDGNYNGMSYEYSCNPLDDGFSESLTKNDTCHTLAERWMKPAGVDIEIGEA